MNFRETVERVLLETYSIKLFACLNHVESKFPHFLCFKVEICSLF